jgi:hypothetical protein
MYMDPRGRSGQGMRGFEGEKGRAGKVLRDEIDEFSVRPPS